MNQGICLCGHEKDKHDGHTRNRGGLCSLPCECAHFCPAESPKDPNKLLGFLVDEEVKGAVKNLDGGIRGEKDK